MVTIAQLASAAPSIAPCRLVPKPRMIADGSCHFVSQACVSYRTTTSSLLHTTVHMVLTEEKSAENIAAVRLESRQGASSQTIVSPN